MTKTSWLHLEEPLMKHFIDSGFDSACFDIWNYIRNIGIYLS